jgi:hypothetical protein
MMNTTLIRDAMVTRVRCRGVNFTPINAAKRETTVETQEQYNEVTFFFPNAHAFVVFLCTRKKINFTTHLISKYTIRVIENIVIIIF